MNFRALPFGRTLRRLAVTSALGLIAAAATAQINPSLINGLSDAEKQQLLQQYRPAGGVAKGQPAKSAPWTGTQNPPASPRKPAPEQGPIAGFEGRGDLRPFGSRLMESAGDYSTVLDIPVPGDYDIGPGDTFELQLFGKENKSYSLVVSRDGLLNLPDIGPVAVTGMSFESASRAILERLTKQKIGVEASVTMGQLRSIQVFLAGDVNFPGSYTTHALTTVTNALLAAGGVRSTGSLRQVELRRNGRTISRLDLYSVLLRGDIRADLRLQPGDVIFVPPVGVRVAVDSGVNRPAIYELLKETTLGELVQLAGGLLPSSFPAGSKIERVQADGSRKATQINLARPEGGRLAVRNGDILSIPATLSRVDGTVSLAGAVERADEYEWRPGMRIGDLIGAPGLLKRGAWRLLGFVARTDPLSGAQNYLPFSPAEVFAGKASMPLEDLDEVILLSAEDVDFLSSANVQYVLAGKILPTENTGATSLVADTGANTQDSTFSAARDARRISRQSSDVVATSKTNDPANSDDRGAGRPELGKTTNIKTCPGIVELAGIVSSEGNSRFRSAMLLTPSELNNPTLMKSMACPPLFDKKPRLLSQVLEHTVTLRGEVKAPGLLPAAPGVPLGALLRAAGGLTRTADQASIEVQRPVLLDNGYSDVKRLVLRVEQLASEPLQAGDMMMVTKRYSVQDSGTVRVSGEVLKPGDFDIRRGERLSEVLARAGGLTPVAYPYGTVFQRVRIKEEKRVFYQRAGIDMQNAVLMMAARTKRTAATPADPTTFAAMRGLADEIKKIDPSGRIVVEADPAILSASPELDVILEPGDEIVIPKRPSHVVVMGEVLNPGAVQFKSGQQASDYLKSAGGVSQTGDSSRVFMILPNGNAEPLKVSSWNMQPTPVPPGSVIYVPRDALPMDTTAVLQTIIEIAKDIALTAAALNSFSN